MRTPLPALAVCGIDTPDLVTCPGTEYQLQAETWEAFQRLQEKAQAAGFSLRIESAHRPFARQLAIWNRKARGELMLLDQEGQAIDAMKLSPEERMWAILHWSALPGTSRHHWGSDLDLSDANAIPPGYTVNLTPAEVAPTGLFGPLHTWLDAQIAQGKSEGFYRPYQKGIGHIQPERWHLSHAPSAARFETAFSLQTLKKLLISEHIELLEPVIGHLDAILQATVWPYLNHPTEVC